MKALLFLIFACAVNLSFYVQKDYPRYPFIAYGKEANLSNSNSIFY